MRRFLLLFLGWASFATAQPPPLYIHIVSHNEPTDTLQQPARYARAKANALQLAAIVDAKNAKWNLQTSDGFVFGARQDQSTSGTNIFSTLSAPPYDDNIEIDPRSKNFPGRNIADQWYLLDSLGAHPTTTVGGFIYYVCPRVTRTSSTGGHTPIRSPVTCTVTACVSIFSQVQEAWNRIATT